MKPDAVAQEAYLYGFPLLLMDAAARRATGNHGAGFNRFIHCFDLAETFLRGVTLPSKDLARSVAWLDLRAGPVTLETLHTDSFYVMSLIDAWTNVFATLGTRATGNLEHRFAIAGPNWTGPLPPNCTPISAPTNLICLVAQTALENLSQTQGLAALAERYRLEPVGTGTARLESTCVLRDIDVLGAEEAFARIRELMIENPGARADSAALSALDALRGCETREVTTAAVAHARRLIDDDSETERSEWSVDANAGNYGTDYLKRARAARFNFLASAVQDVLFAQARVDARRLRLRGSKQYLLHFDPWDEPPARAFWSLRAYDEKRGLTQPAARATIDSRQHLARRSNRSLDIYLAHDEPPADDARNWLACPPEDYTLALRLYWPQPAALSGVWTPPAIAAL